MKNHNHDRFLGLVGEVDGMIKEGHRNNIILARVGTGKTTIEFILRQRSFLGISEPPFVTNGFLPIVKTFEQYKKVYSKVDKVHGNTGIIRVGRPLAEGGSPKSPRKLRRVDIWENQDRIIKEYNNGSSVKAIAAKWDCSQGTIRKVLGI